ncbi:MAG: AfsR/SARP family transcriptional regulator [Corynebacteriales bacterium]|nr:AfsR/SARP family transcriptional regulator [Mycobacteriales bacterium]
MQIGVLGSFEVRADDGAVVDVPGARLRALLIALALQPGRVVPKTVLVEWIWGEHPPADAANALQRLVSRLRKALPLGIIEGQIGGYRLIADPGAVDAVRFENLVSQARHGAGARRIDLLREALALWRGKAMQDIDLPDSQAFDASVTRLEGLRLAAIEDRFDAEVSIGQGAEAIVELTDLVAANPLRERLAAALMRALVAAGRDTEALLVYERIKEALVEALGADPSLELAELHGAVLRGELSRREQTRKTNMRAELTSFIGKDTDVTAVRELTAEHRLTTLIGPGGSGKTRLATETARTLLNDLPDGAWLVELAAIDVNSDIAQATLAGLGLRDALLGEAPYAEPVDRLIAAIREREMLLILDNCEHIIEFAALFAERLLGQCQRLRILATSREPLGITGEALWLVEPLALPESDAQPSEITSAPAVRLLRDRASAVRKNLAIDADTLSTIARICRALDGMPLAIELAAARLRTMSMEQLANRLDDRFRLLTGGSRTALPRHKTLRAVVDWSWELLTEAERVALRRLSIFSGGASLKAAERVCADDAVHADDVLELLTALTEKSLLVAEGGDAPRYRMLGTIKEYAHQRLVEAEESELARRAHLAYFSELLEAAEPHLRRAEQLKWLAILDVEHDNITYAMRGALTATEAQAAMRIAAAAGWYWWLSGHRSEGMELLTAAAKTPGEVTDESRAMVYALIVLFVSAGRGDEHQAEEWIHQAYRFSRRAQSDNPLLGLVVPLERMLREPGEFLPAWEPLLENQDPWVRALARLQLGKMRVMLGHGGRDADAYLERALADFQTLGERFGISFALSELAERIATRGEFAESCELYEQAIRVTTQVGAIEDLIRMRSRQAELYWLLGDQNSSRAAIAEAERSAERVTWPDALVELAFSRAALARWSGNIQEAYRQLAMAETILGEEAERAYIRAIMHDSLGYLAEDLNEAREHRAAAFQAATEAGHPPVISPMLVGVADFALRLNQPEQAARLLAASVDVLGLFNRSHPDATRIERATRESLGEVRFAQATREGSQTSWSELIAVTLAS